MGTSLGIGEASVSNVEEEIAEKDMMTVRTIRRQFRVPKTIGRKSAVAVVGAFEVGGCGEKRIVPKCFFELIERDLWVIDVGNKILSWEKSECFGLGWEYGVEEI